MVMTTSEAWTASGVRILGLLAVMSMPTSFIAATATVSIWSAGAEPAERTSACPWDRAVMKPAAIWERPALWTQTNMTLGRWDMGVSFSGWGSGDRKSTRLNSSHVAISY